MLDRGRMKSPLEQIEFFTLPKTLAFWRKILGHNFKIMAKRENISKGNFNYLLTRKNEKDVVNYNSHYLKKNSDPKYS